MRKNEEIIKQNANVAGGLVVETQVANKSKIKLTKILLPVELSFGYGN